MEPISREQMAEARRAVDDKMLAWIDSDDRTLRILLLVKNEREKQHKEWGDAHDDGHAAGDWSRFIVRHLGRAEQAIEDGDPGAWRKQMIRVAALAVAALEARADAR